MIEQPTRQRPDDKSEARSERRRRYREEFRRLRERDQRPQAWTPWLLIRYRELDLGLRPIPAGDTFYLSPDISVESSDPLGNAVAGEKNFVRARLFNLGKADAVPTRVDFFWGNPNIGLGPEHMNLIGTEWVEIPAHSARDIRCNASWVPVLVNGGHECLIVNCTAPILDPLSHPFQPILDRHVGQRNITVVAGVAGQTLSFAVDFANFFPFRVNTVINARVHHLTVPESVHEHYSPRQVLDALALFGAAELSPAELAGRYRPGTAAHARARQLSALLGREWRHSALSEAIGTPASFARSSALIRSELTELPRAAVNQQAESAFAHALLADQMLAFPNRKRLNDAQELQALSLAPTEHRRLTLELTIPDNAREGEFVLFHITRRAEHLSVGGYAIAVRVGNSRWPADARGPGAALQRD